MEAGRYIWETVNIEGNKNEIDSEEIFNAPKKTHKSNVWRYFGFFKRDGKLDKTHAICKQCRAVINYIRSTTNMATHMKRRHGVDTSAAAPLTSPSNHSTEADNIKLGSSKTGEKSISSYFSPNAPLAANSTC